MKVKKKKQRDKRKTAILRVDGNIGEVGPERENGRKKKRNRQGSEHEGSKH